MFHAEPERFLKKAAAPVPAAAPGDARRGSDAIVLHHRFVQSAPSDAPTSTNRIAATATLAREQAFEEVAEAAVGAAAAEHFLEIEPPGAAVVRRHVELLARAIAAQAHEKAFRRRYEADDAVADLHGTYGRPDAALNEGRQVIHISVPVDRGAPGIGPGLGVIYDGDRDEPGPKDIETP